MIVSQIKKYLKKFIFNKNGDAFCAHFNFWNKIYWKYPVIISSEMHQNILFYVVSADNLKLYHPIKKRLYSYQKGIVSRLSKLASCYFIDKIPLEDGDNVIDCGANIGEVGMYFQIKGLRLKYYPIEPSIKEATACDLNNSIHSIKTSTTALWKENTVLDFYVKEDSADSSLIEFENYRNKTTVNAVTLDEFCIKNNIDHIKWLKLEGEGAEPEILLGAHNILKKIDYVSVDCGFERGKEKQQTFTQVLNQLHSYEFELVDMNFGRVTCLFKKLK